MKAGTRIETYGTPATAGFPGVAPEAGVILRWRERIHGKRADKPGWHIVLFSGASVPLCVHESGFRVISN